MSAQAAPKQRVVELTRVFDAPRERVFAAWTRAEHLMHWFGPKDYSIHSVQADPRGGGLFRLCMRSSDGRDYWVHGVYREIVAPARLVIVCTAEDETGKPQLEEVIEVTLTDEGDKTRLSLRASASGVTPRAAAMLQGMEQEWHQTIDRLNSVLSPRT